MHWFYFQQDNLLYSYFSYSTAHINKLHGLMNPEVQCHIHKGSPIIPILSQINPITRIDTYLFKVHSNIVLPSTPRPP